MARSILLLLGCLALAGPARASAPPDSVVHLPVFDVLGRRISAQERLDRGVGVVSVLEQSSWRGGAHSAGSVLARAAGVSVREQGGVGGYSTLSIRGASAKQVPIYLDGVLLNDPQHQAVDLADIPLHALDRIEVYRGSAPLVLGGGSLGGAVHLQSARPVRPWLALGAASHDTRTLAGGLAGSAAGWRLSASLRGVTSQNDWEFDDDNGTLYNPDDDARVRRTNNDARGGSALLTAQRPWGDATLRVATVTDLREQGSPGHSVAQSDKARDTSFTHQTTATLSRRDRRVRSVQVHHRVDRQAFLDPGGDLTRVPSDRADTVHSVGVHATGSHRAAGPAWWRTEVRWSRLQSRDRLQAASQGEPQTRWITAVAAQPAFGFLGDRLLVSPGVRVEWHHDRFHGVPDLAALPAGPRDVDDTLAPLLQLGARWRLGRHTSLKASVAQSTRPPTLLERFGRRGAVAGNPDLDPEESVSRDLALVWHEPATGRRVAVSVFDNDLWDLIQTRPVSPVHARAANLGRASSRGAELEMDLGQLGPWSWRSDLTVMSAVDRTDDRVAGGHPLVGRPGYELRTEIGWRGPRTRVAYELVGLGHSYLQSGSRERVPGRLLHGVRAQVGLSTHATLSAGVRNLTDRETYDLAGFPLPGRTVTLTLSTGGPDAAP